MRNTGGNKRKQKRLEKTKTRRKRRHLVLFSTKGKHTRIRRRTRLRWAYSMHYALINRYFYVKTMGAAVFMCHAMFVLVERLIHVEFGVTFDDGKEMLSVLAELVG